MTAAGVPDFVIVPVAWEAAPAVTEQLVERGVRVLSEIPPAPDLAGLRQLWNAVDSSRLVPVAEQNRAGHR